MNDPLVDTSCISCGNCVDACPTGALTMKYPFNGRACLDTEDIETHCGFCSLGCEITVRSFGDNRYFIKSSGKPGDYLCRYGRFGNELFIKQSRIKNAIERDKSTYNAVQSSDANAKIVEQMKKVAKEHGPESVAVFISPELTNEEFYIASKIARDGIGSNNIGSLAILSTGADSGALDKSFGFTASTTNKESIKDADLIICNNTALEDDHLILAVDVIQRVKDGAKLIVTNSTLANSDQHLATLAVDPMRGRSSLYWNAVMEQLLTDGIITTDDKNASNIVFVHSNDRPQDASPEDIKVFANLTVMLNNASKKTNLLLPRLIANSAGLEVMGAEERSSARRFHAQGIKKNS